MFNPTDSKQNYPNEAARKQPVRVLIVAPSLGILGGQAIQASRLIAHFQKEDSLRVGFQPIDPRLPGVLSHLQRIKYVRTIVTSVAYILGLLARAPQYDVIHIFSASYASFVIAPTPAILIARLFGKPSLLNYRSGAADDHLKRWRTARPTMRLVQRIIAPSGYLVDVFARHNLRAEAIFNFVDTSRFRFRRRAPLAPRFLSNRNHESHYNVACILRAFRLVQNEFQDASLTVAGDGVERVALEGLSRELKLQNVSFIGRVKPEDMPALYDAADIYLNAPDWDNMPGSIIEAYAAGTPVVTTNAGGIPYIVTHEVTGLMVDCNDHEAMAREAKRLLRDAAFADRIALAAHAECRKYAWESVRAAWLRLYHTMRDERGRGVKASVDLNDEAASRELPSREVQTQNPPTQEMQTQPETESRTRGGASGIAEKV